MTLSDLIALIALLIVVGGAAIAIFNYVRGDEREPRQVWSRVGVAFVAICLVLAIILAFQNATRNSVAGRTPIGDIFSSSTPTPPETNTPISTATTAPTATLIPTATPIPKPGTVLYSADWSQGMNGWTGAPEWKTTNGMLVSDGSNESYGDNGPSSTEVMAPYQPGAVNDYAVEVRMQYISVKSQILPSFGIVVRENPTQKGTGYYGAFGRASCCDSTLVAFINLASGSYVSSDDTLVKTPYFWDNKWHTYRLEVQSNKIRLLVDGNLATTITDNNYLAGGAVALRTANTQVQVSSIKIIAL